MPKPFRPTATTAAVMARACARGQQRSVEASKPQGCRRREDGSGFETDGVGHDAVATAATPAPAAATTAAFVVVVVVATGLTRLREHVGPRGLGGHIYREVLARARCTAT